MTYKRFARAPSNTERRRGTMASHPSRLHAPKRFAKGRVAKTTMLLDRLWQRVAFGQDGHHVTSKDCSLGRKCLEAEMEFPRRSLAERTKRHLRFRDSSEKRKLVMNIPSSLPLVKALLAACPASDRAEDLKLYEWLVGEWEMDVAMHGAGAPRQTMRGIISAAWVLEGRAIQDVFAVPGLFYGTSLRFYDPSIGAWQVFWIDPLKSVFFRMIGRAQGNEIVNEGKETPELARAYGLPEQSSATVRWIFGDIRPNSFHWRSERSSDGAHWSIQREYFVRRVARGQNSQVGKVV